MKRIIVVLTMLLAFLIISCGSDNPTTPGGNTSNVDIQKQSGMDPKDELVEGVDIGSQKGMVLIPQGEFEMGNALGDAFSGGDPDELPVHTVYLDAFYMDIYEVTNAQYSRFLNKYGKNSDAAGNEFLDIGRNCLIQKAKNTYSPIAGYENYPVSGVSWYGADAYADFYGKRLPTEAEWEKAARGGLVGKRYPWGNKIDPSKANYDHDDSRDYSVNIRNYLTPVGSFQPNGYGLYDVAGNVYEWCSDWYSSDYYEDSHRRNPTGPNLWESRVSRGGSCYCRSWNLRVANRNDFPPSDLIYKIDLGYGFYGVRCAKDTKP